MLIFILLQKIFRFYYSFNPTELIAFLQRELFLKNYDWKYTQSKRGIDAWSQPCSPKTVALGISDSSVRWILHFHFSKFDWYINKLCPQDLNQWVQFCKRVLEIFYDDLYFPQILLMSDEPHFHLNWSVNSRHWAPENPEILLEMPLHYSNMW